MENKDQEFIEDYLNIDKEDIKEKTSDVAEDVIKTMKIVFSGDNEYLELSGLVSAMILNYIKNKVVINYESDLAPDVIKQYQDELSNLGISEPEKTIDNIDVVEIDFEDINSKKTIVKGIYRILNTKFTDGEFEDQPLEEIFGSINLLRTQLESGALFFYEDNATHAFWGYRYQPDFIGKPGDYVVLYGENELELVHGIDNVLSNYRLPDLKDLLDAS